MPVNFLLGRIQEPVAGPVHEWILEHQTHLQTAFEGAQKWLRLTATRRKQHHHQQVKGEPLREGQLVYIRDFSARRHHKIQDLWSLVVHQVLRAPREGGSVYTIVPVGEVGRTQQVHHSLLKLVVHQNAPRPAFPDDTGGKDLSLFHNPSLENESYSEDDLLILAQEPLPSSWKVFQRPFGHQV